MMPFPKTKLRIAALALLAGTLAVGAALATRGPQECALRPLPEGPSPASIELLEALPFQLDVPYVHEWRAEKPPYSSGVVLVLRTDPELVRPRQSREPVLYVGGETAERVNAPLTSGNLVVVVPAPLDEDGEVLFDAASTPIWFGTPELPERVGAATISSELELALARGVGPATPSQRLAERGAVEAIHVEERVALDPYLADLIELYSPDEVDLIDMLRGP
jgi:hypothetical protein